MSGIWILIADARLDADLMRRFIQGQNEEALRKNSSIPESITFNLPFGNIDLLDYVVFERFPEDSFSVKGDVPSWFSKLYPQINLKSRNISYHNTIEYFDNQSHANALYKSEESADGGRKLHASVSWPGLIRGPGGHGLAGRCFLFGIRLHRFPAMAAILGDGFQINRPRWGGVFAQDNPPR